MSHWKQGLGIASMVLAVACGGGSGGGGGSTTETSGSSSTTSSGGDATASVVGSCNIPSLACEEYRGPVDPSQVASRHDLCTQAGGTWADGACPGEHRFGGCESQAPSETGGAPGTSMMAWAYEDSATLCLVASQGTTMRASCEAGGGTYTEIPGAVAPTCP